jgi:WD40 repeat protein
MGGSEVGSLQLFAVGSRDKPELEINAANHPLTIIRFNREGSILATCSERGTLIRLFDSTSGATLSEFRRGMMPAVICSLAFSHDAKMVTALSNKGTVHLFEVGTSPTQPAGEEPQRAALMWKMGEFEPSTVEFLGDRKFGVVRFRTGVMETLVVDLAAHTITAFEKIDMSGSE